ncbi:MAG: hypothetical protein ACUVRX_07395 [Actinomycetota bacterium]
MAIVLLGGGASVAAWRMASRKESENSPASPAGFAESFKARLEENLAPDEGKAGETEHELQRWDFSSGEAPSPDFHSGEDLNYGSPDQRYVTETQRHQNFLRAIAEGRVTRLDVVSTDVRPVGDPDTSYVYFTLSTADGGTSNGTMVMKFEGGMWRIAAVSQLRGDLGGGTNYRVPSYFEEDLAQEIAELQPFLTKVAEGRLDYLAVHSVSHPSENETVLTGVVAGVGGRVVPAEMRLRRDCGIWHLTYITNPP